MTIKGFLSAVSDALTEQTLRQLRFFAGVVVALPILFICIYAMGDHIRSHHIALRLAITLLVSLTAIWWAYRARPLPFFAQMPRRSWVMVALVALIALSHAVLGQGDTRLTVERTALWLVLLALGLTLYGQFRMLRPNQVLMIGFAALVGASTIYVVIVAGWWSYSGSPTGETCTNVMPGFRNVRYTNYFAAPALAIAALVLSRPECRMPFRLLAGAAAVLLWAYIEYTGARGAALSIVGACIVCLVVLPGIAGMRLLGGVALTFVIAQGVVLAIPPADCGSFGMLSRVAASAQSADATTGRVDIWLLTWELIKAQPLLGHGEVRLFNVSDTTVTQPHNAILQTLLSWGFVGGAIFFALVLEFVLRLLIGARRAPWQAWPFLFGLLVLLAYGQLSGALYHAYPLLFATILSAGAAALILAPRDGVR